MSQTLYIDSKTFQITTSDPRVADDGRQLVELSVYEGMSAIEALATVDGWIKSFRGVPDNQRVTVARVTVG